jgi:RHS repeat-associated protein
LLNDVALHGDFNSASIQFQAGAADGPASILRPGQSGRELFYFQPGPDGSGDFPINFDIAIINAGAAIDWASLKAQLRPSFIQPAAWDVVFTNLVSMVGTTTDQYQARLAQAANYLSSIGIASDDTSQLWSFLLAQANAQFPAAVLASVTDAAVETPGLSLSLDRSYLAPISGRDRVGIFGFGWATQWESTATADVAGNVTIDSGGGIRYFAIQPDGSYRGGAGEYGSLSVVNGSYVLTETNGQQSVYDFSGGKLEDIQDTNGNRISLIYDNNSGRLTTLAHSSDPSLTLTLAYNANGTVKTVTDAGGRVTTYTYSADGLHLTKVVGPQGTTQYAYVTGQGAARENALAQITNRDGTNGYFSYDAQGRLIGTHRDSNTEPVTYDYPADGEVTVTDALNHQVATWFSDSGQPVQVKDGNGSIFKYSYDTNLNLVRTVDPLGGTYGYAYDDHGGLTSIINPLGQTVSMAYGGPFNQLAQVTDARGNSTNYGYDAQGNLLSITYPGGGSESFTYDPLGNLTDTLNRRGHAIHNVYDLRGRITETDFADGTTQKFTYDNFDNMLTAVNSGGTTTLKYATASNNRLTEIDYPGGTFLKFTYDTGGRRTQSVDQDGFTVKYLYDTAGRLSKLTDAATPTPNVIVQYTYDTAGNLSRKDNGNGTATAYTYDAAGHVTSIVNYKTGTTVNSALAYTYDANGHVLTSTDESNHVTTYTYDAIGELISVVLPGGFSFTYSYDAAGNRTQVVSSQNGTTTYTVNSENEITKAVGPSGTTTYTYDADGNQQNIVKPGNTGTYTYNDLNQLTTIAFNGSTTSTLTYNALGDLTSLTNGGVTTSYLNDPIGLGNVVGSYTSGSLIDHYTYGLGLVSQVGPSGTGYYDFDVTGNTTGITGSAGTYVNRYTAYLPFGDGVTAITASLPNPFTFVGQSGVMQLLSSNLFDMRARLYAADLGQFTSHDPLGVFSDSPNTRQYAGNDPVGSIDPSGLDKTVQVFFNDAGFKHAAIEVEGEYLSKFGVPPTNKDGSFNLPYILTDNPFPNQGYWQKGNDGCKRVVKFTVSDAAARAMAAKIRDLKRQNARYQFETSNCATEVGDVLRAGGVPIPENAYTPGYLSIVLETLFSHDPNDLLGPPGFGPNHYTDATSSFNYTIEFENSATATAAAQEVLVTQKLNPNLDWTTFQFTSFNFGSSLNDVPAGLKHYQTTVSFHNPDGSPLNVRVTLDFNQQTGLLTATLDSIDPATGALPLDALAGFLPPNDSTKRGEGFVSYSVQPKAGIPDGTQIVQAGTVYFDGVSLDTPAYVNTTDVLAPTSHIVLTPKENQDFTVKWTGDDHKGSGIATFDVYMSINNAAFTKWQSATTVTQAAITGATPHDTYAFYVVATDNLGHVENKPATAETQTVISDNPWQNAEKRQDVDHDGIAAPQDLVALILQLNGFGAHDLSATRPSGQPFFDVDGDHVVAPRDIVDVIIYLNAFGAGEGEASSAAGQGLALTASLESTQSTDELPQETLYAALAVDAASQAKRHQ